MTSVSFDRAATFYDATRGYAVGIAEGIRDAIIAHTGATQATRFLELGVGTGRIALPFMQAGYDYTGVDISGAMLDKLRDKLDAEPPANARYELREADVAALPFADATFDVVLAVQVFHLVGDRRKAMEEARRVLRPGGWFLHGHDTIDDWGAPRAGAPLSPTQVRRIWVQIVQELSNATDEQQVTRWVPEQQLAGELRALGATAEIVRLTHIARPPLAAREMAALIVARSYSSDWHTTDAMHAEATRRLEAWLATQPNIDTPVSIGGDFEAIVARWPTQ